MKRFNKTVVSLATAGALGFGVAPIAFAEDAAFGDLPVTPGEEGATSVDANYPANPTNNTPGTTVNLPEGAAWDESIAPAQNAPATSIDELGKQNAVASTGVAPLMNAVCVNGGTRVNYLRHADGLNYVKEGYPTTGALPGADGAYRSYADITADANCALVDGGQVQGAVTPGEVTTDPADVAKAVAAVVGAGVGAAIIINGVKYFLNKDGKTLVETPERVNMDATPEEKAKSEQLIKENAAEINNGAAQNERGIAAATGVNKIPAALLSLLLASVLAAAAFVFGRRQLV